MTVISSATCSEKFLSEISVVKRYSSNTLLAYRKDLEDYFSFLKKEKKEFDKVSERIIRNYLLYLDSNRFSRTSVARKLACMRNFYLFCLRHGYLEKNPLAGIRNPKIKRKLPETVSKDALESIFNINPDLSDNKYEIYFTKAVFELLYGCALRVSEICSLEVNSVDYYNSTIRVLGKGGKTRYVPLGAKSIITLREYLKIRNNKANIPNFLITEGGTKATPQTIYRLVKHYLSNVTEINKKSPHILRHSAATHLLNNGADLLAVKEILGHENLSTTQIYTHVSIEKLKDAYKKAHPKS